MAVTEFDGRAFEKFVAAGTYFLRKYRGVLNDLNVFPVPDGDTGSNLFLTARAALGAARTVHDRRISAVAAAAARGSLLGARGNSGVILSQMLRGFSHAVRHRDAIDTFQLALAMKESVGTARAALAKPVEGTILSVASAAADEAYRLAVREPDFYRLADGVLRAANQALDRTPEQLAALRDAGVVDAGGAGFCYFLEGVLRFRPEHDARTTAFPRRPVRSSAFGRHQSVGEHRWCTEFVLERATIDAAELRGLLERHGESLLVGGEPPTLKVHVHAAEPELVRVVAAKHGEVTRWKRDDMAEQHRLLVVEAPERAVGIAAVVAGAGFERIARDLGAEVTIPVPDGANPSVGELVTGLNASLARRVYLLPNDPNVLLAAREAAALVDKDVVVVPTRDPVAGNAALLALAGGQAETDAAAIEAAVGRVGSARVFLAGKETVIDGAPIGRGTPVAAVGGRLVSAPTLRAAVAEAAAALGAAEGGLVTLYYGGAQKERDAQAAAALVGERFARVEVEYYYGGQPAIEYWVSVER